MRFIKASAYTDTDTGEVILVSDFGGRGMGDSIYIPTNLKMQKI